MSGYYAELILSGKGAYKWDVVRDFDGVQWAVLNDAGTHYLYKSVDGGKNWAAVGTDPSLDGNHFDLMVDSSGNLAVGTKKWGGSGSPTVRWYDEENDVWTELATGFAFITSTSAVVARFAVDTSRQPYIGLNRYVVLFTLVETGQTNVKYADVTNQGVGIRINSDAENQYEPKVAVSSTGTVYMAYRRATTREVRAVIRLETEPATFSPTYLASASGHDVENLLDLRIQPTTDLPAILYVRKNGTDYECWLSELQNDGSWDSVQVSDGSNNPKFWNDRALLQYDERGSIFVASVNDEVGGTPGTGRPHIWYMRRALEETSWSYNDMTPTGVGGTTALPPAILACRSTQQRGIYPIGLRQGIICWPWVWPSGNGPNDQALYYVNLDEYPGDGPYATILAAVAGEPMYRASIFEIPEEDLESIVLEDEGTAVETYPDEPDAIIEVDQEFEVIEHVFILGYVGTMPKYASGRRVLQVTQSALTEAEKDAIVTFLEARIEDKEPFNLSDGKGSSLSCWLLPEGSGDEVVIAPEMVDVGVWRLQFNVLEIL
jgi:hypothetical protein